MGMIVKSYTLVLSQIEMVLQHCLEKSNTKSKYKDCKCIDLSKFATYNISPFAEIVFDEHDIHKCIFIDYKGGEYTIGCYKDFSSLCVLIDKIDEYYKYYGKYTNDEINELTLEELSDFPLPSDKKKYIATIFNDDSYSDESYIEELRRVVKEEFSKTFV